MKMTPLNKARIVLVVLILSWWAYSRCHGQTVEVYNEMGSRSDADWKIGARQVFISGGAHGRWLTIFHSNNDQRGFEPSMSEITTKCKPTIKELPDGFWRITFTP